MSRKLLLADDSITIQKVIGITFAHEDYELIVVGNGEAALQKARASRPDLILADVFMPGKNGYELCAAIKGDPSLAQVPVLLLSGTFEPFDEQKARDVGADSWISKPFESQALIERVEKLLSQPQPTAAVVAPQASVPATPAPESPLQEETAAVDADLWADMPPELAAAEWDQNSWQDQESAPLEAAADPWQNLTEASASAEEELSWEEPVSANADEFNWQEAPSAAPVSVDDEDDLWGAVSFGEEDLLGEFGETATAEDDLWGEVAAETKPSPPAPAPPVLAAPAFAPSTATVVAQSAESGSADSAWDEEDILSLDDLEILEEEDIVEEGDYPSFAVAGEQSLQDGGTEISFDLDGDAEPSAAQDGWGSTGIPAAEGDPAVAELLAGGLHEPDWSSEVRSGDDGGEEDNFLMSPAEVAMEAAQQPAPPPSKSPALSPEQLTASLQEADLAALVEKVAGSVIERLAASILERVAWEVVPDLAENLIKDEIRRLKEEVQ
jgi:CheY-like chemotaxis protein